MYSAAFGSYYNYALIFINKQVAILLRNIIFLESSLLSLVLKWLVYWKFNAKYKVNEPNSKAAEFKNTLFRTNKILKKI